MCKFRSFIITGAFLFVSLLSFAEASCAQDDGAQTPEPTRIETDSGSGEIRFYVDGTLSAVLKEDGLHVRESMTYSGTMTDSGQRGFEDLTGNADKDAAAAPSEEKDSADAE